MFIEHFTDLLKELGENIGLSDLKPDKDALCSLRFDDKVTLDFECQESSGALIISSIIGTLLPHEAKAFYPILLEGNLLWGGTGGATLGVDPLTLTVFLCYQEKMEGMEFLHFQDLIKGFSDTALFWNQRLQDGPGGSDAKAPKGPAAIGESTPKESVEGDIPLGATFA